MGIIFTVIHLAHSKISFIPFKGRPPDGTKQITPLSSCKALPEIRVKLSFANLSRADRGRAMKEVELNEDLTSLLHYVEHYRYLPTESLVIMG